MYRFINSEGTVVKARKLTVFASQYGLRYSSVKSLACGWRKTLHGFCSTSKRAKKARERFTTVLVNTSTGERLILGQRLREFARTHGLSVHGLTELVQGHVKMYRHWALEKTMEAACSPAPLEYF
jgi:hypothetical protein